MDKGGPENKSAVSWLQWVPTKLAELKKFFVEVKAELKKVTWPSWPEVRSTTIVVIFTTIFFGFYLAGLDFGLSQILAHALK